MGPVRLTVTLQRVQRTAVAMTLPIDVKATFGQGRPPVRVRINGYEWRSTPAKRGGEYYLVVNRAAQAGAGVDAGDTVDVELELDTEERTVAVPLDLAAALKAGGVSETFEAMSPSHRREYVEWVEGAKRAETRARRIAGAVERIAARQTRR